eukprot:COSAG02_NODE_4665_length_5128_cov_2.959936_3_plen_679_part_00
MPEEARLGRAMDYDDSEEEDTLAPVEEEIESFEIELEEEHNHGRSTTIYLLFQTTTLALLPIYGVLLCLAALACYEVTNPISIVVAVTSFIIPWLLYFGFRCAAEKRMEALRCYAFLLLLAVCLQISLCLVILLDDCSNMGQTCIIGAMTDEYLINIADAVRNACQDAVSLEVEAGGVAGVLPYREICACLSGAGGSTAGSWWEDDNLLQHHLAASVTQDKETDLGGVIVCLADAMKTASVTPSDVRMAMLATVLVEFFLAFLAYHMMVDLDLKAANKENKQKGGPRVGTLRGTIIGGRDLRSGHDQIPKSKRANNHSSRYAVLEANNEILVNKEHRKQECKTQEIEDDKEPVWNLEFDDVAMYRGTKKIEVKVYDVVQKGKKKEHVLIGRAGTVGQSANATPNGIRINYDEGTLSDLDFSLNGNGSIWVQLFHQENKEKKRHTAGQVEMRLQFAPTQAIIKSSASLITDTWYFEYEFVEDRVRPSPARILPGGHDDRWTLGQIRPSAKSVPAGLTNKHTSVYRYGTTKRCARVVPSGARAHPACMRFRLHAAGPRSARRVVGRHWARMFATRAGREECGRCGRKGAVGEGRVEPSEGRWLCSACTERISGPTGEVEGADQLHWSSTISLSVSLPLNPSRPVCLPTCLRVFMAVSAGILLTLFCLLHTLRRCSAARVD